MSTAGPWACRLLDGMSKFRAPVEWLSWTFSDELALVAMLVNAELISVLPLITAALSKSGGRVSHSIRGECDGFPVEASSDAPWLVCEGIV